jgi:hypothetical protein
MVEPNGRWPTHEPGRKAAEERPYPPGEMAVVLLGLTVGVLLMGVQLLLLTVALELYLSGEGGRIWQHALASGGIFLCGLLMLWLLRRRPRVRRGPLGEPRG